MNMKKKGFTLIELLAVIVILAIIAVIATPIVLNIIEDTKQQASLRSADFYLDALELSIAQATLDDENITDGTYNIIENGNICLSYEDGKEECAEELELEVKGEIINKGTVTIKNGQIDKVSLVQNNKIIEKDNKGELTYKKITAPKSFAEDEWNTIIDNVKTGNTSVYEKNFNEGVNNTKEIALTGFTNEEKDSDGNNIGTYTVRIANTSTPEECNSEGFSQTACGFVVEFVDIITIHAMNSTNTSVGGWRDSEMRQYINNDILKLFPEELQKSIIPTYTVSNHESDATENYKTDDKLYLLSTKEIYGTADTYDKVSEETRQLDYYKKVGVTTDNYGGAVKNYNGSLHPWWLRSASSNYTNYFFSVYDAGYLDCTLATDTYGVAVAFRI